MEVTKFKDAKVRCSNCDNVAVKVVEMMGIRLWLCKKCNNDLLEMLKK